MHWPTGRPRGTARPAAGNDRHAITAIRTIAFFIPFSPFDCHIVRSSHIFGSATSTRGQSDTATIRSRHRYGRDRIAAADIPLAREGNRVRDFCDGEKWRATQSGAN
jgi:hypothetical protein